MRLLAYLEKTFLENLREWKILSFTLVFAPAFVYMMWAYFGAAAPAYRLLIVDRDSQHATGTAQAEVAMLLHAWRDARHPDGKPVFNVVVKTDMADALALVKGRDADLLVVIPEGFTAALQEYAERKTTVPARLQYHLDAANVRGSIAQAMSDYVAFTHVATRTGVGMPLDVSVSPVGSGPKRSEFDLLVPALLTLAIIMILFTAAASLVKEVDKGTMTRLMLSRLSTPELLTAVSLNQMVLGLSALALAYLAAVSCGYRSDCSLGALFVVGAAGSLAVVSIAVLVSAFLKSMFALLTVGTFPFFVLMFFSECMFPLPKVRVFSVAGHAFYANDILPTTFCTRAFNKVLNMKAGLAGVAFELGAMLALTLVYFVIGGWLFSRRHQRV